MLWQHCSHYNRAVFTCPKKVSPMLVRILFHQPMFEQIRTVRTDTIRYDTLRYVTLGYVRIRYYTLLYVTIRYVTMRYVAIRYDTIRYVTIRYEQIQNRYEQVHVSGSHSLNTTRLKTIYEEAARRTNATASFLCALFDKPIRLRASVRAVRKTNQNYCLCSPQCGFRFVRR